MSALANQQHPKKVFAMAILSGRSTFEAAKMALGENHPDLFEAATLWPGDLMVLQFQDAIRAEGTSQELSKLNILAKAVKKFDNAEGRDAAALLKIIADIQGWTLKNSEISTKKIKVLDTTGELSEQIEKACYEQQAELVNVARR